MEIESPTKKLAAATAVERVVGLGGVAAPAYGADYDSCMADILREEFPTHAEDTRRYSGL